MRSRLVEVYEQVRPGTPDCSIVMPVYNGARFLGDSLGAVLRQSGLNCEILISDDCSEDGSLETIIDMVRPYAGPHTVRVYRTEIPAVVENMPLLVEASRADCIVQAHQDDVSDPQRALVLRQGLVGRTKLITSVARISKGGTITEPSPLAMANLRDNSSFRALLQNGQGVIAGARYGMHRDLFRLFPPLAADHLSHGHDVLLYIRAKFLGAYTIVHEPLITIGDHPQRGSYQLFDRQDPATRAFDFALRRIGILSVALTDLAHAVAAGAVSPKRASRIEKRLAEMRLVFIEALATNRELAIQRGFRLSWVKRDETRSHRSLPL